MLKLTNSFCRYLKLTFENINHYKAHTKQFTHLSYRRKDCQAKIVHSTQLCSPSIDTGQQMRLLANIKKRFKQKQLSNSNESKKYSPMGESLQPSLNHMSYGGQFTIDEDCKQDGATSRNDWQRQCGSTTTRNAENREASILPSNFRFWEPVLKKSENDGNSFKFKILSYNVLAQYLLECHPYLYTDCAPHNLKWAVRATKLFEEITNLAPDILCLQEVQVSHLESFYSKFEEIGYCGMFKQKTGHRHDGCAIYFKQSSFEMVDHISVEFYQPDLPLLNRDNIGLIVKLLPRNQPGPPIVVATTHLLYNPKRTDVRLAQIQVFLAEIDRFAYCSNGRESGYLPIILTGDFNSTPESAVIKLLDRGHVRAGAFRDNSDWKRIGVTDNCQHLSVLLDRQRGQATDFNSTKIYNSDYPSEEDRMSRAASVPRSDYNELFNTGVLGHTLKLKSAYNKYKHSEHHEATTFQDYWVTVDYIYFSCCSNLRLVERLRLPTASECGALGKLPNDVYGSDHLVLAAAFELKTCKSSSL